MVSRVYNSFLQRTCNNKYCLLQKAVKLINLEIGITNNKFIKKR